MARPKKDGVKVSFVLDRTIHDRLADFTEDSGQSKTVAVEKALTAYMDDYYEKMERLEKNIK